MRDLSPEQQSQLRNLENNFKTALRLHEAGKLAEAGVIYEQILDVVPRHAETLDLFGRSLFERGELARSFEVLSKAVAADPHAPSPWNHLGVVAQARGDLETAIRAFEQAVALRPDNPETLLNFTVTLAEAGRWEASLAPAMRARELAPAAFAVRLRLGVALRNLDRNAEAVTELQEAARLNPLEPEVYLHLSACYGATKDRELRLSAVRRGILVMPERYEIYTHLGGTTAATLDIDAVKWARGAVRLRPSEARMWDHLSSCCHGENRFDGLVSSAERSILLSPGSVAGYNNLATGFFNVGAYSRSIRVAEFGLTVDPGFAEIEFILCQSAFCDGRPDLGWHYWPSRLRLQEAPARIGLPAPEWRPGVATGGRLLVCAEQGVGDEILYFSCLPDLLDDTDALVVECEPRWTAILERSLPGIQTVPRQIRTDPDLGPVYDYTDLVAGRGIGSYVFCGTLPQFYRRDISQEPPRGGYLRPDPKEAEAWTRRLRDLGPGPYIGVCWRSGFTLNAQRTLYYPDAVDLMARLPSENATFISLLYGELGDDIARVREALKVKVHHFDDLDQTVELDRVAALMSCLDLIIAPSSTVCHLASSVGAPTISMAKSNFMCVDERDPLFLNLYPVMRRNEPLNPSLAAKRTGEAVRSFLANGRLPRLGLGKT